MTIRDYIKKEVFAKRAAEAGCLVIYDPSRKYREIANGMVRFNEQVEGTIRQYLSELRLRGPRPEKLAK